MSEEGIFMTTESKLAVDLNVYVKSMPILDVTFAND